MENLNKCTEINRNMVQKRKKAEKESKTGGLKTQAQETLSDSNRMCESSLTNVYTL